jgi:hypothetical protein
MKYFWWGFDGPHTYNGQQLFSIDLTQDFPSPTQHTNSPHLNGDLLTALFQDGYTEISYKTAMAFSWPI